MYFKERVSAYITHKDEILKFINNRDYNYYRVIPPYFITKTNDFAKNDGRCYHYTVADYKSGFTNHNIEIEIKDNKLYKCSCDCNLNKVTGSCYHLACVLYQEEEELFHDVIDESAAYLKMLQRYEEDDDISKVKKEVNLEIQFNCTKALDRYNHESYYKSDLKILIGENKMYSLLSHIGVFLQAYKYNDVKCKFGKDFTYDPKVHYFSKINNNLITLIVDLFEYSKKVDDSDILKILRYLHINGIPFKVNNHVIETVYEGSPLISNVIKENNDYKISFNYKDLLPLNTDYDYVYSNGCVYNLNINERNILEDIFDNEFDSIIVSQKNFHIFSNGLLKHIKNNMIVDDSAAEDIKIGRLKDTELYFDIAKDFIKCKVIFDYKENKVNYFDKNDLVVRDFDIEANIVNELMSYGFEINKNKFILSDIMDEIELLENGLDELAKKYRVFTSEKLKGINLRNKTSIRSSFGIGKDNILSYKFELDNIKSDELIDIFKSMNVKKKYYRLKNGDILNLEDDNLVELRKLTEDLNFTDEDIINGTGSIPKYRALYLDCVKNKSYKHIETNSMFDNFINQFYEHRNSKLSINDTELQILRDYQVTGVKWLYNIHKMGFGGILADEMGLGKTIQTIYYIKQILLEDDKAKFLIVVPTSLVYNWKHEFELFGKDIKTTIIYGPKKNRNILINNDSNVFITSYGLIREDEDLYKDQKYHTMFIDEAQSIKNFAAGITKCVKKIDADTKFALTGTPIENTVSELWSIFDFIMPGYLGDNKRFNLKYKIKDFNEETNKLLDALNDQIRPFILRRKKADVTKDLPDKIENNIYVELTEEQKVLYAAQLEYVKKEMEEIIKSGGEANLAFLILPLLTKLRQLCIDPRIIYPDYKGGSNKIDSLIYVIKEKILNGEKMLVFTSFRDALNIVAE